MQAFQSCIWTLVNTHTSFWVVLRDAWLGKVVNDLFLKNFGVVDEQLGSLVHQIFRDVDTGRLPGVATQNTCVNSDQCHSSAQCVAAHVLCVQRLYSVDEWVLEASRTNDARLIVNVKLLEGNVKENQRTNVYKGVRKQTTWNGTNLVSPVSFLNEKPSRAIFLPVTVLKRQSIILQANRRLWYSFISITWGNDKRRLRMSWIHFFFLFFFQRDRNIRCFAVSHLLPVGGYLGQVEGLAQVHQIQHILLETAPTKTWAACQRNKKAEVNSRSVFISLKMFIEAEFKHLKHPFLTYAGFEKLAAYSLVHANRLGYLLHIGSGGLTQSTDTVDAADSLCQECIGCLHKHTPCCFF